MTIQAVAERPRYYARVAGIWYLMTFVGGMMALFLGRGALFYAVNVMADLAYLVVTILFYVLLAPVNRGISLVAAVFSLLGIITGLSSLFQLPRLPVNNLVFFGFYCLLIGYLIMRSTFLPPILGALMAVAGLGWLTFLSPELAHGLQPWNMVGGIIGEGVLMVWLLVAGVNAERWRAANQRLA